MNTIIKFTFAFLLSFWSVSAFSQSKIIQGQVLDANGKAVQGAIVKPNKSKETAVTNENGMFLITVTPKDKELRMYMHGLTIMKQPISASKVIFAMDSSNDPSIRGYLKGDTYYPGSIDLQWDTVINSYFTGVMYQKNSGTVMIGRFSVNSPSTAGDGTCLYYEVDGAPVPNLSYVELPSVYSIRIIKDMAESLVYGALGQYGAVIITTRGMQKTDKDK